MFCALLACIYNEKQTAFIILSLFTECKVCAEWLPTRARIETSAYKSCSFLCRPMPLCCIWMYRNKRMRKSERCLDEVASLFDLVSFGRRTVPYHTVTQLNAGDAQHWRGITPCIVLPLMYFIESNLVVYNLPANFWCCIKIRPGSGWVYHTIQRYRSLCV